MRQPARGSVGRAVMMLCAAVLGTTVASCDGSGMVVLVTVAGVDNQVTDLGVVAVLDNGARQAFPRQHLTDALSPAGQLGVLLPPGAGAAVSIEIDGYLGDCLVQQGEALVALSGDALLSARVMLGPPASCAPVQLQVVGPGTVTSRDAPDLSCGPNASCMYWLDDARSYVLTATPPDSSTIVDWLIDGSIEQDCSNLLSCTLTLSASGHVVTVIFNQMCDPKIALAAPAALGFSATSGLHSVWGVAGQEVWAVGDLGTVARYHSGGWSLVTLHDKSNNAPVSDTLSGVFGLGSPSSVFVVGRQSGTNFGTSYLVQDPTSDTSAMVGATVLPIVTAALAGVNGFDLLNLWAVGTSGSVFQWNIPSQKFEGLQVVNGSPPTNDLNGVSIGDDAAHTLWTVSDKSQLYSLSSAIWTTTPGGSGAGVKLLGITQDSGYIYAVGTGSTFIRFPRNSPPMPAIVKVDSSGAKANLNAVWAGSGYVFTVGEGGAVFCSRSSGAYWTRLTVPIAAMAATFQGVYGSGHQVWVVGGTGPLPTGILLEATFP